MSIFLTKRAEKNYHSIKKFISEEWGEAVSVAFEQKTKDFFELLEKFPELGGLEFFDKEIRGFQLTRQTRVFYRIKEDSIIILSFFDVRQNPAKSPK
ncbi:MAG: type II toxin-antitoxin system RelE/ParE family toxin [Balneolaceae bacterium]